MELEDEEHEGETMHFPLNVGFSESEDIKLRNRDEDDKIEDLIDLPFLHEPAILQSLYRRFQEGLIYTFTGPILIAVNPFKRLPLYTEPVLQQYYSAGLMKSQGMMDVAEKVSPHVYAIADNAYRDMMSVVQKKKTGRGIKTDQAILISGESGAGKTESTKIVMRYLTAVGNTTGRMDFDQGSIMDRVLQSNPILEAFGNAKTNRNDNSSRFGKYIELLFSRRGHLVGAQIETYLLEKVRLASQLPGERNFHIFYQMTAQENEEVLAKFGVTKSELALEGPQRYRYTNQGGVYTLRFVNDVEEFDALQHAMEVLSFSQLEQQSIIRISAALLHLGQVHFKTVSSTGGEGSDLADDANTHAAMAKACELLGVDQQTLTASLTKRTIDQGREKFTMILDMNQAADACAAVVKAIYLALFEWIVKKVNESIACAEGEARASIGVLDIFGFECFERNNFEQLCINYTNETLQQHFNSYVFKLEQAEYEREKIEWSFIEFPDNKDCLELIESKPDGIFATLDDECRMGQRGNDRNFANRLYKKYVPNVRDQHGRFGADVAQRRDFQFSINHYAGPVVYDTDNFIAKNKDELPPEAAQVFTSSTCELLRLSHETYREAAESRMKSMTSARPGRAAQRRAPTVATQFKNQLHMLMNKINATAPHYIRCIKPNDLNSPDIFARMRTVDQLRYGGVLEAVRVARSGFPVRLHHADFYSQYRPLLSQEAAVNFPLQLEGAAEQTRAQCSQLVDSIYAELEQEANGFQERLTLDNIDAYRTQAWESAKGLGTLLGPTPAQLFPRQEVQLGLSKVFMRKGAYEMMESCRTRRLGAWARRIQSTWRCMVLWRSYNSMRVMAIWVQRHWRGYRARREFRRLREDHAARVLQAFLRGAAKRIAFVRVRFGVQLAQRVWRGKVARRQMLKLRGQASAVAVQRIWRGHHARREQKAARRLIVAIQCRWRRHLAKKKLRELRAEARSVGKLQQNNDALKAEIEQLKAQAQAQAQAERQAQAEEALGEVEEIRAELEKTKELLEKERKRRKDAEKKLLFSEQETADVISECDQLRALYRKEKMRYLQLQHDYELTCESADAAQEAAESAEKALEWAVKNQNRHVITEPRAEPAAKPAPAVPSADAIKAARAAAPEASITTAATTDAVRRGMKQQMDANNSEPEDDALRAGADSEDDDDAYDGDVPPPPAEGLADPPHRRTPVSGRQRSPGPIRGEHSPAYMQHRRPELGGKRPSLLSMIAHKLNLAVLDDQWDGDEAASDLSGSIVGGSDMESVEDDDDEDDGAIDLDAADAVGTRMKRLHSYENHLNEFQERLRKGIEVRVWDVGGGRQGVLCSMKLKEDGGNPRLSWEHSITWRRTLFGSRTAIPDLPFFELEHIWTGHSELHGLARKDESRYITIVTSATPNTPSRSVVIMCYNRTQRNGLLQGMRKLIADIEVLGSGSAQADLQAMTPRTQAVNETSLAQLLFGSNNNDDVKTEVTPEMVRINSNAAMRLRRNQRPTIADAARGIQERAETHAHQVAGGTGGAAGASAATVLGAESLKRYTAEDVSRISKAEGGGDVLVKLSDVQRTITAERLNYEKLMIQMLENQNDLNDKEDEIANLRRQVDDMRSLLTSRDEAIRNDSQVRMRLAKRIEDLENDQSILEEENEKLLMELEELRKMKRQVEDYKRNLASAGF